MNSNSKPLISIIVPVYNIEKYLPKCIESILNQTYENLDIILVDDGTPDSSGNICDMYKEKDNRIRVIHKENGGVSSARNTGIDNAKGEYICFIDGDDYVMEDYVEYLYQLLIENEVDISLTTDMFGNFNEKQTSNETQKIVDGETACESILCYKIPIGVYCKLFKHDFIKKHKIKFFEDIFMGEGFNFNVFAFQRADKVAIGNRKIYYYRRDNSSSATTKFSLKKCENSLYALEKMKNEMILKTERISKAWEYAKWRTYSDAFDYMVLAKAQKSNLEKYKEYKKYIIKYAKTSKKVPISKKDKLRASIMGIIPNAIPMLLKCRRIMYRVKIDS